MLLHEHLNYFDSESLNNVLRAADFEPLLLEPAKHGGVLLCCAVPKKGCSAEKIIIRSTSKFQIFLTKVESALQRFSRLASKSSQGDLGLYVPIRSFPYLGRLSPETRVRFFDDDPGLHGRYFDGFDIAIENRDDLLANPPEQVMICSLAFGEKIAIRLHEKHIRNLNILMWSDLFDPHE